MKKILLSLQEKKHHGDVLSIAVPMILSNITVPLLGMVDTAVIGHLDHTSYLGGVAMGSTMVNVMLFLFGFLRMATSGMTAQACGARHKKKQVQILFQGVAMAGFFALIVLIAGRPLSEAILTFSDASTALKGHAEDYFLMRILSCPAALMHLVFIGWFLGHHQARKVMGLIAFINFMNIILDLIFVPGLKMGVKGVAMASVIADYSGFLLGLVFVLSMWKKKGFGEIKIKIAEIFENVFALIKLNLDIFIRSLLLQLVLIFMTFKGATFGDTMAAVNAILVTFLLFFTYIMDGFAYTMEVFVGSSLGARNPQKLQISLAVATFWGLMISCLCAMLFYLFGEHLIAFMSSMEKVREVSRMYLPWLIIFPLLSMGSFLLDGVFVGATLGKDMRNGMVIASMVYFISYGLLHRYENHALWASMMIFMATRWLVLGCFLKKRQGLFRPS